MNIHELYALFPAEEALTALDAAMWLHERACEIGSGGLIVEVGSWCGWTATAMALGGPTVLCIDSFRMHDPYVQTDAGRLKARDGVDRPGTLDLFAKRVADAGFGGRVVAVQALSVEAANAMAPGAADLLFLDGDHLYEAVRDDVLAWAPVVKPGGLLCLDNWDISGVSKGALEVLATLSGWTKPVEGCHQIWWTRKPL